MCVPALLPLLATSLLLAPQAGDSIGDGGPATAARLVGPAGVAIAGDGTLYVSERGAHRVRRIDGTTGVITTLTGRGVPGTAGDGGPASEAFLSTPTEIALDADGNLLIAEAGSNRIRVVDLERGRIATFAGTGVRGFSGDGGPARDATFAAPFGVAVDAAGDVWVSDTDNHRIRRIDRATGTVRTVVGTGNRGFSGDGGPATAASLTRPHRLAVTAQADLLIGDSFNHRIRLVNGRTGEIRTVVGTGRFGAGGDGGPADQATITYSGGVAVDSAGRWVYTDVAAHRVRRIDPSTGRILTVAGTGRWDYGGDGGPALEAAFHLPGVVSVAPNGDLLIADMWNGRVRRISRRTGIVSTVAGSAATPATPSLNFHFHHNDDSVRARLHAPVAVEPEPGPPPSVRRLAVREDADRGAPPLEVLVPAGANREHPVPLVMLLHEPTNYPWDPIGWGGLRSWAALLASRGVAAAIVSHRLGSAPASIALADDDLSRAAERLRAEAETWDPDRICIVSFAGASTLVAPLLAGADPGVRCIVMFSPHAALEPPALWDWYLEAPATRRARTPGERLGSASPPLFLAMGLRDRPALVEPFEGLVAAAVERGLTVEVARHPTGEAAFERLVHDDASREIVERAVRFLERHLGASP